MKKLSHIKEPVISELNQFEKRFGVSMKSKVPLLNIITRYILKRKGKQIRPLLVFLSAKATGNVTDATYTAASLIELLHTATLVHDDVVDDSNIRRGFFSINALWKNKIAVLVGDYLLSRGLLIALENQEYKLLQIVSNATQEMSEGELLQIEKARNLNVTEEIYFEIIKKKTASLLSACCACGASSSGASDETIEKMALFGEKIGIAFQLKDDILDYAPMKETGKPSSQDIKEKKLTLPVLYTIAQVDYKRKRRILHNISKRKKSDMALNNIIKDVHDAGGIEYARKKTLEYYNEALEILDGLTESSAKESLANLARFIIEREK